MAGAEAFAARREETEEEEALLLSAYLDCAPFFGDGEGALLSSESSSSRNAAKLSSFVESAMSSLPIADAPYGEEKWI